MPIKKHKSLEAFWGVHGPLIFVIEERETGHHYIGLSTADAGKRIRQHRDWLIDGTHHCKPLQLAWKEHGGDAFRFQIVEIVPFSLDPYDRLQAHLDQAVKDGVLFNARATVHRPRNSLWNRPSTPMAMATKAHPKRNDTAAAIASLPIDHRHTEALLALSEKLLARVRGAVVSGPESGT